MIATVSVTIVKDILFVHFLLSVHFIIFKGKVHNYLDMSVLGLCLSLHLLRNNPTINDD